MIGIIKKAGVKCLKEKCRDIEMGESVQSDVRMMWDAMYLDKGVGLAANQIGLGRRIIVVHAEGLKQEFINPVITKSYGGKTLSKEGCLSFPGITAKVLRSRRIIVEGYDSNWVPVRRKLKGLAAYCVQHEIDHLDGVTIA